MRWCRFLLVATALAVSSIPCRAGIFFGHHSRSKAADVPALVMALKTAPDERKRAAVAEEMRQFDPAAHPEIVPALIDAALGDAKAAVRYEAVQSLGRLRPVSQEAGRALELAASKDDSTRVRWQARTLLFQYRMAGYHSPKTDAPADRAAHRESQMVAPGEPGPAPKGPVVIMAAPEPVRTAESRSPLHWLFTKGHSTPAATSTGTPSRFGPSTAEPPLLPREGDGPALPPG